MSVRVRSARLRWWIATSFVWIVVAGITAPVVGETPVTQDGTDPVAIEFFEKKIRPLLAENCFNCHSANTNSRGGLRVDDRHGLIVGGESGPAIVVANPSESLLLKAVRHEGALKMPPSKQLAAEQIEDLATWIRQGAAWPQEAVPDWESERHTDYDQLRREHWAWQPLSQVSPPPVNDSAWPRSDVDRFILARLENEQLEPVADADRRTLIRRVTFDLTGLPPTPEDVQRYLDDNSETAFETVVDRLLASRAFGEKWGRHWLDLARYAESTGSSRNLPYPHAWRYRDYVIKAFNDDKPYDQFLREQIAGDLLPANTPSQREEQRIATGFLALGVKDVNQRFKVRYVMDNIDEQIDTVSRSILALTASCARCHDHKFDPIPTADYYALAGIFQSTDLCDGLRNKMGGGGLDYYDTQKLLILDNKPGANEAASNQLAEAKAALQQAREELIAVRDEPEANAQGAKKPDNRLKKARQRVTKLQQDLERLSDPARHSRIAHGVRDSAKVGDTEIRIRGEAEKHGPVVPRGFLSLLEVPDTPALNSNQSGRLELAQWLTSSKNPLTPRVMVNRVWQHLYGQGLVVTVDNFGVTGGSPSHPELLNYLAARFIEDGWSVKQLVRQLVLSRAYQLSCETHLTNAARDPANQWIWRHRPRRLSAEEIRDATLAAAGTLQLDAAQASPAKDLVVREMRDNGPEAQSIRTVERATTERSVYLPLLRSVTPTSLQVFDFAEQGLVTGRRDTTTVAPQALYLLNDPFVEAQSLALANRLLQREDLDDAGRIEWAYQLTLGRAAAISESERVQRYLVDFENASRVLFVDKTTLDDTAVATDQAPVDASVATTEVPATAPVIDPDQEVTAEEPTQEVPLSIADSRTAAWTTFCQSLIARAEFRFAP